MAIGASFDHGVGKRGALGRGGVASATAGAPAHLITHIMMRGISITAAFYLSLALARTANMLLRDI